MAKKLIIFDMDGTLVDSSITIVNAINHVRSKLDLKPLDSTVILNKVNDPKLNPALYFYGTDNFSLEQERWFSEYYTNNHKKELFLYPKINNLLETLSNKNYKLALATNAYRVSTLQSLEYLNIINYFSSITCYDDVKRGKPSPQMLEKNLSDLSLEIDDALFIGDSERDLEAANSIGMDYIMINWGFSTYPDAIHSIDELKKKILDF